MDMFCVRGGTPLRGKVAISGSKNASLPMMAAAIAIDGPLTLRGVPSLADVTSLSSVLQSLGVDVERTSSGALRLESVDPRLCEAPYELVRKMRASVCVLGPLLGRRGEARVSLPGGCNIGNRPIDLHLKGLEALGAQIQLDRGYVIARASRLRGATIDLCGPAGSTVTGTCNVLMAAIFAEGTTTITSAACEPEVVDLGCLLNRAGAKIAGLGTPVLKIEGVQRLSSTEHAVIPDRIEAATLLIAAAATRGEVEIQGALVGHLRGVIDVLRAAGVDIDVFATTAGRENIVASRNGQLRSVHCSASPYPGFPTDVQAQLTSLLTLAPGESSVTDTVFPTRFMHVPELCRLGADIRCDQGTAIIHGGTPLQGASVMASDLRASAGLLIAALAAQGTSEIRRIYHLDRGYERLEVKLQQLGASVVRVRDEVAGTVPMSAATSEVESEAPRPAKAA
jgi:UDP-N-acetylglucosamine 1-carboxyvinyltransferase